jgi:hypothetical protein
MQFQVAGVGGFPYVVQSSSNLVDWVNLETNVSPFLFQQTGAANSPMEFYRAAFAPQP